MCTCTDGRAICAQKLDSISQDYVEKPSLYLNLTKPCSAVDLLSKLEPINYLFNIVCLMFLVQLARTVHAIRDLKQRWQRLLRKRHFEKWICAASNFIALILVVVVQRRLRNVHKKRDARAKLLFCQSQPIGFLPFSLPSPSSLHKLPIISLWSV